MRLFITPLLLFAATITLQAQNTLYQAENETLYRDALELLDKSSYAAARQAFEVYMAAAGKDDVTYGDAQYYVALCALHLYHGDGEKLIENFIQENPSHPKAILAYYELGNFYFKEKDYKRVVEYLGKVNLSLVTKDQRHEILFKLGYAYFARRQFDDAATWFNLLKKEKNSYAAAANYYSGYIAYEKGDYATAVIDLQRAAEDPAYIRIVPAMIANAYYKQKNYDELIAYSEKILASGNINQKDFYLLAADAYMNKGDFKNASRYFSIYHDNMKNPPADVHYRMGYAAYRQGDGENAIDHLKQAALDKDSIGTYASYYLGVLYLKQGNKRYAQTAFDNVRDNKINATLREEAAYQYAKVSYDLDQSTVAIDAFQRFLTDYPESKHVDEVNDLLSEAYLNSSNYNLAITHIEKMPVVNPKMREVYQKATYMKGSEFFNQGNYRAAIDMFRKSSKYTVDAQYTNLANLWTAEAYAVGRKYDEALPYYQNVLGNATNQSDPVVLSARYGIGYVYFNDKAYDKAMIHFKMYVNRLESAVDKMYYDDALLRLADCYYVSKKYGEALVWYRKAIQHNKADNDYAHLHAGIVLGLENQVTAAKAEYDYIIQNLPRSRYYDDALYQKAQLDFEKGNYESAVQGFSALISKKPTSQYIPYAHMRRASSYYNLKQYAQSSADYERVLDKYPTHSLAQEALLPLQEVLNLQNKGGEFDRYLSSYKQANPEQKGLEGVEYETAKGHYYNLDYQKSIAAFGSYIKSYPDNPKAPEARYYIAESYYRMKQHDKALDHYNQLLNEGKFDQISKVLNRVGELEYAGGRYENAIYFYYQLVNAANTKKEQYYGWAGLMESYYHLGKYDSVKRYAHVILEKGNVNISSENKASLYLGKAAYGMKDYEAAKDEFLNTLNTARDEHGAEAQYLLGEVFYLNKNYQQSIETLIALNNNFNPYQEWVGKSYLLLAENYLALGDTFQAKGTLKSIIDKFPMEAYKEKARKKLAEIEQKQQQKKVQEKAETDSLYITD